MYSIYVWQLGSDFMCNSDSWFVTTYRWKRRLARLKMRSLLHECLHRPLLITNREDALATEDRYLANSGIRTPMQANNVSEITNCNRPDLARLKRNLRKVLAQTFYCFFMTAVRAPAIWPRTPSWSLRLSARSIKGAMRAAHFSSYGGRGQLREM